MFGNFATRICKAELLDNSNLSAEFTTEITIHLIECNLILPSKNN